MNWIKDYLKEKWLNYSNTEKRICKYFLLPIAVICLLAAVFSPGTDPDEETCKKMEPTYQQSGILLTHEVKKELMASCLQQLKTERATGAAR